MKGRALRRALETSDAHRISGDIPLIVDTTELITPDLAYDLLLKNKNNRPINWQRVEEYAAVMQRGEWVLHAQGIVLDTDGNLLTGQKRLWAVIYSGVSVYMRVSRGNPPTVGKLLDRGAPQTARDLAARGTGRKHSPTEANIARGVLALRGTTRPSTDDLGAMIEHLAPTVRPLLDETAGTKKTRSVLMILAALTASRPDSLDVLAQARGVPDMAARLDGILFPKTAQECWGHGAAFSLAMDHARRVVASGGCP